MFVLFGFNNQYYFVFPIFLSLLMLNQLRCRTDVLTHVFELSMETSAEGCLQGADTRGDYPIKVTGVLVGNFREHP